MPATQMNVLKNDAQLQKYKLIPNAGKNSINHSKPEIRMIRRFPESHITIFRLNDALDALNPPLDIDETTIEHILVELERWGDKHTPAYWLLMARLAELTVFMTGYHADACRFSAAGDLMINPRKILVYMDGQKKAVIKHRHCLLSDQFNPKKRSKADFMAWFMNNAQLNTVKKPLLSHLYDQLAFSGKISDGYLQGLQERMKKISDTIGFMAAWGCTTCEDLFERLPNASLKTREFITANQCNFDTSLFWLLGEAIQHFERGNI
jgi:hypothetical protein